MKDIAIIYKYVTIFEGGKHERERIYTASSFKEFEEVKKEAYIFNATTHEDKRIIIIKLLNVFYDEEDKKAFQKIAELLYFNGFLQEEFNEKLEKEREIKQ